MSCYRDHTALWGQPAAAWFRDSSAFGELLRSSEMTPQFQLPVGEISAVLWDPSQPVDDEGDHTYTLILGSHEFVVFSKKPAREFLCHTFDANCKDRDWLQRRPSATYAPRVDFATRPAWRARRQLPLSGPALCAVALVPAHVLTVIGHPTQHRCGVLLRGQKAPLVVETGAWTAREFGVWLLDADQLPAAERLEVPS